MAARQARADDPARVLEALGDGSAPPPFVAAGFSLGGNLLLRYAGMAGGASRIRAVAALHLANLARPGLILSAVNDPFVPVEIFAPHHGVETIRFLHPEQGGHCGYWQRDAPRYWAAETILDFFDEVCG